MLKNYLFLFFLIIFLNKSIAQITSIPDANFEKVLIQLGIDSDKTLNGQVLTSDISEVLILDVSSKEISDLTGIEDFDSLKELYCGWNELTDIVVDNIISLEILDYSGNPTSANISNCINLKRLICDASLGVPSDLSNKQELTYLSCAELQYPSQTEHLDLVLIQN